MNLDADGNAEEDQSIQRFSRIQIINLLIIKFKNFIFGGYKALLYILEYYWLHIIQRPIKMGAQSITDLAP